MNFGGFKGAAKRIEDIDLPRIGKEIGVGEDEIHAVLEVESAGSGFDAQGRPKILFEPHVFYRCLAAGAKRDEAVRQGLAYPSWRRGQYPKDSYPRLHAAIKIDETAALKAASWGLGQILGENHKAAGYATPQAMVLEFMSDEDNHLEAMIRFMKSAGIAKALKAIHDKAARGETITATDWVPVARPYNGAGYATHNYHGRLAVAHAKWRRIKDTPYTLEDIRKSAERETAAHEAEQQPKPKVTAETGTAGSVATVGTGAAIVAVQSGARPWTIVLIVTLTILTAVVGYFAVQAMTKKKEPEPEPTIKPDPPKDK